tara:strand:- start:314 stop:748 length:435 start_codon:yes stop_codon:yes gene_type:complete
MLRYITIFFLAVSFMSCEKEPLEIVEVQQPPVDTLTVYAMGVESYVWDSVNNITIVNYKYYAWDSFDMPVYMLAWLATNPPTDTQSDWLTWAMDTSNTNPDYFIYTTSDYYMNIYDVSHWNGDYEYNQFSMADLLLNGDVVVQL